MPVVDIHTHVYPPSYMRILESRSEVPYVRSSRLIILPGEDELCKNGAAQPGRPVGPDYYDISKKLAFMDQHGIDVSVISLANPWLDFLPPTEAGPSARMINDEIEGLCARSDGRLFAFGALPLSASVETIVAEIQRLKRLKLTRGVIMGTSGLGRGLDDPALDPIWASLQAQEMLIFLHPHYGLPTEVFGPRAGEYGHVLPLALGFPLETTVAVARMLLSGVWDRFPELKVLLAHSGGTLPFLAGRLESCIQHDGHLKQEANFSQRRSVWDVLTKNIYLDAVIYSQVGLEAAVRASTADRVLFGTDHPFFPPLDGSTEQWMSVTTNRQAISEAFSGSAKANDAILGGNAMRLLNLES
ncbi:MAG: hypothetical protein M1838_005453 [Thelocarpon superellum]|nr:MAG: hypothetical protein M1838_005453 [Thelocarpon superellum]